MRKGITLLLLLFITGLAGCGSTEESNSEEAVGADSLAAVEADSLLIREDSARQITGILRSSGLQPQEAEKLGISSRSYQLISRTPYFFEAPDSLQAYMGQCISLFGDIAQGWEDAPQEVNGQTTYGRVLYKANEVELMPPGLCFYSDTTQREPMGRSVSYAGKITRMPRPAPDIAYDYQLQLQNPYRDENNPYQPGMLIKSLPLISADYTLLSTLEQAVRTQQLLYIRGVQHQGYAESEAVWVLAADSVAL